MQSIHSPKNVFNTQMEKFCFYNVGEKAKAYKIKESEIRFQCTDMYHFSKLFFS